MRLQTGLLGVARLVLAPVCVLSLMGCMGVGGGGAEPETTATTQTAPEEGQIDIRRYIGPDYCPEIRIPDGFEVIRHYESGHQDDADFIIWQASISRTARECLYDLQGGLLLRVGVSGRVISGPKGTPGDVTVPIRIIIEKYKEGEIASELHEELATIPASGSTVITKVYEFNVPSPGEDKDYLINIGFDPTGKGFVAPPEPQVVRAPPPPPPPAQPAPQRPPRQQGPRVLPTPSGGFVLPGQ